MLGDASHEKARERGSERVDRTLIEAARSGDEEAFASIARGSADRLFAVAHRILRDVGRAEDAVQQTLVTAWRELPGLREVERFDAWIHRILVHACYAEARRAQRWSANVKVLSIDQSTTPDVALSLAARDALERGFRRLPPEQSAVFVLHHYLGLPLGEIAEQLGVPLGTVKSRMHYATASLRAALDADARTATPASRERMA
jgi:RNA polymerase sigma-70 factor, ECF subfamily